MKTIVKLGLISSMVAALLVLAVPQLYGYGRLEYYYNNQIMYQHWFDVSNIVWNIDNQSPTNYQQGCQESFDAWENIPYTDINFSFGGAIPVYMDGVDGYNLISFNSNYSGWGQILGFSQNWVNLPTGEIYEVDIILNPNIAWVTVAPTKNRECHLQSVVTHELGHFQGMSHSLVRDATMFPFILPGTESFSFEMDDICGHGNMLANSSFYNMVGTITGRVTQGGTGLPVPGAHVLSFPPGATLFTEAITGVYTDPDGYYSMYAPPGEYGLYIEPLDGNPTSHSPNRINEVIMATADTDFPEEWWNVGDNNCEGAGGATFFTLAVGQTVTGKDFVTNENCVTTYFTAAKSIPEGFTVSQNYPNPFNPVTQFSIDLTAETHVSFRIYNVTGQVVKTLVDAPMTAGSHTITWNGTNNSGEALSSGVYFYRVVAGEEVVTSKMTLMK
jgi:hypothetical protein